MHWFIHPQNNLRNKDLEEGEGGLTGGQRLVPAVEFRSEGGEDGMVSSAPLLSSQSEKSHMQTVQATSGALVYLSALLSRAPSSYKSACLGERCSNLHPRSSSLHNFIHIHLRPIRLWPSSFPGPRTQIKAAWELTQLHTKLGLKTASTTCQGQFDNSVYDTGVIHSNSDQDYDSWTRRCVGSDQERCAVV